MVATNTTNTANTTAATTDIKRGSFNQILLYSLPKQLQKEVENLVEGARNGPKIDEHGGWNFGIDFDKKGRGSALNWDLYAVGRDYHDKRRLIVIQVRQYVKKSKKYYPSIKKSYFLIGRNEDNSVFAHCVPPRVVHDAINKEKDIILAVQNWIFDGDYKKVLRQGDIGLIPMKRIQTLDRLVESPVVLQGSHVLTAAEIGVAANGAVYALNPHLHHTPETHPDIQGTGWFRVVVGNRSEHHDFAPPTID